MNDPALCRSCEGSGVVWIDHDDGHAGGFPHPCPCPDCDGQGGAPGALFCGHCDHWHLPEVWGGGGSQPAAAPFRSHRIEGGSVSCAYCNRTFTFNMMRNPGPHVCDCAASRNARLGGQPAAEGTNE